MQIKIALDFTTAPGPRYISEGKFSGEQFRTEKLLPKVREAVAQKEILTIDLDGVAGYGTSFLEETFGGLIRENDFDEATLNSVLRFVSTEEPKLLQEIAEYIKDAENERAAKG